MNRSGKYAYRTSSICSRNFALGKRRLFPQWSKWRCVFTTKVMSLGSSPAFFNDSRSCSSLVLMTSWNFSYFGGSVPIPVSTRIFSLSVRISSGLSAALYLVPWYLPNTRKLLSSVKYPSVSNLMSTTVNWTRVWGLIERLYIIQVEILHNKSGRVIKGVLEQFGRLGWN